jgi:diguanylate cyclase (GGDEF)-like protein/PAS domain S-box-containing protein
MPAFKLTRYFSLTSLALIVLAAWLLGTLISQHQIGQMERAAEARNVSITQMVRNLLSDEINRLVQPPTSTSPPQAADMQQRISPLLHGSDVIKVKIYDAQGRTVFSTDPSQLGIDQHLNPGFISAQQGVVVSELVHRKQFSALDGERQDVDLISSYVPVSQDDKNVAVFELYQDVTPLMRDIERSFWSIWGMVCTVLGTLYILQLLVVRRAQKRLREQEALLEATNRDLDARVAERSARVEELLRQQQVIFDNTHVGILVLQNRKILQGNQRMAEMFGFAGPDKFTGQTTRIFYATPERFEAVGRDAYSQLATRGFANFETQMIRQDGSLIWVLQTGRPIDYGDVLDGPSIWVYTDITEIRRAEAEARIAAVAFESQEGMLVTDALGIILRVNKAFTDLTGYTPEEIIGQRPAILASGKHDKAFFTEMWRAILAHGSWSGEIWNKRKSGEIFPEWLTISAVKAPNGLITHYVGTHTDITDRKKAEERITHLAFFDQLTGLPNRTLLLDRLQQAMAAGARTQRHGAVLFLDLDHFKALNDVAGHDQGDKLLRDVAEKLTTHVRQCDSVARLGGDEFVIVLADLHESAVTAAAIVEAMCRKLVAAIKHTYALQGTEFHCSASIGATLFLGNTTPVDELLKQADLAMYKSKEAGRNGYTFFDQAMGAAVIARVQMEADLRRALDEAQFTLHYQPQLDGASNRIAGVEALIRWQHPVRGLVPPDEFIPAAEDNGLIVPLGLWVLETGCRQLAAWAKQPHFSHLTLAVNVSVHQFLQPDFVDQVLAVLGRSQADPHRLKLELTESLFVANVEDAIVKMKALKAHGIGFSLDDFGTGYSSMAYLSKLPLDQLKIDRSFVADIDFNEINVAICAATVSLAHNLKLKVVAEGVETESQRYFLSTVHHCDLLQGYLISRPLPLQDFENFCIAFHAPQHPIEKLINAEMPS